MAEAGIIAYGVGIGMAIALAAICLVLRGKGHSDEVPVTIRENNVSGFS